MKKKFRIGITFFLGFSMFAFGMLKFIDPFKTWYEVQVEASGFSSFAYWSGQLGEIAIGLVLLLSMFLKPKISICITSKGLFFGSLGVLGMMIGAFVIHFHPEVPSDVLPLKIKEPYIPGFFALLAVVNLYLLKDE